MPLDPFEAAAATEGRVSRTNSATIVLERDQTKVRAGQELILRN
jgi:hypothetical protein